MKVRIARRDGTSDYVEGALEQPWYGTIVLGLYGKEAPLSVAKFLKYVDSRPNFKRSQFYRLLPGSLVEGGRIAGMTTANLAVTTALQFLGEVLPSDMSAVAVDVNNIKHKRRGLLTHPKLEPTPEFGITLAPQAELDGTNVVFGELIDGEEFLQQVEVLPVLQDATPGPLGDWLKGQKEGYRALARAVGDDRVKKVFPNKILRRVEVDECGMLRAGEEAPKAVSVAMAAFTGTRLPTSLHASSDTAADDLQPGSTVRVCKPVIMHHIPKAGPINVEGCAGQLVKEITTHGGSEITANYPFQVKLEVEVPEKGLRKILCHLDRSEIEPVE
jgi:cyclophilin family peptidyl-prolyl cis-trans isomerase